MSDDLKVIDGGVGAPNAVLKTLDLTGFKSFVHKTHLEFAPGITAIIGPNGSGKTNIVDGIRWALGENNARILRAKRNEELIFGGSESRKALGMAEGVMQADNPSRPPPVPLQKVRVGARGRGGGRSGGSRGRSGPSCAGARSAGIAPRSATRPSSGGSSRRGSWASTARSTASTTTCRRASPRPPAPRRSSSPRAKKR